MTSYSDNAYDVTISCFEKSLAYTLFLQSFIIVRRQMTELNWGRGRHLQRRYSARETDGMQELEKHNLTRIANSPAEFLIQF